MRGHEGRVPQSGWYGPDGGREEGAMRGHVPHLGQLMQSLHHPALGVAVERRRRLVKQQDARGLEEGPDEGEGEGTQQLEP